jgi:uncharacterized protein
LILKVREILIPTFPARIYANQDLRLTIFVSELNLDQTMHHSISKIILQWAIENECELIISAAGMPISQENIDQVSSSAEKEKEVEMDVFAAASTTRALERLSNQMAPGICLAWWESCR